MDSNRLSDKPWWTEADQAQLDYLIWGLVKGLPYRKPTSAEIQRVLDWKMARVIKAKARFYSGAETHH